MITLEDLYQEELVRIEHTSKVFAAIDSLLFPDSKKKPTKAKDDTTDKPKESK